MESGAPGSARFRGEMDNALEHLTRNLWEEGEEDLAEARRAMAAELREAAMRLDPDFVQEPEILNVVETPPFSRLEVIAYGLQQELDHTVIARILGGGQAVRHIRKKEHVCFITHQTEEAAKRTLRIGKELLMAEGWQCKRITGAENGSIRMILSMRIFSDHFRFCSCLFFIVFA